MGETGEDDVPIPSLEPPRERVPAPDRAAPEQVRELKRGDGASTAGHAPREVGEAREAAPAGRGRWRAVWAGAPRLVALECPLAAALLHVRDPGLPVRGGCHHRGAHPLPCAAALGPERARHHEDARPWPQAARLLGRAVARNTGAGGGCGLV